MKAHWTITMAFTCVVSVFGGTISIQPSSLTVTAGQNFLLAVNVASVTDLYAFQFDIMFTPSVLSVTSVTEGAFLPSGGATAFVPGTIDNAGGRISFVADTLIGAIPSVSGSGTLAAVQFKALGLGTSPVNLSNITLLDSALADITATSTDSVVNVVPEPATCWLLLCGGAALLLRKCRDPN